MPDLSFPFGESDEVPFEEAVPADDAEPFEEGEDADEAEPEDDFEDATGPLNFP